MSFHRIFRSPWANTLAVVGAFFLVGAGASQAAGPADGLHLLIDDYMIASSTNVVREVAPPVRSQDSPVVRSGSPFANYQPWLSVHRDEASGRFRMWYNAAWPTTDNIYQGVYASRLNVIESDDGINWEAPSYWTGLPLTYGAYVIDAGVSHPVADERYRMLYIVAPSSGNSQIRAAFSPNGFSWTPYNGGTPVFLADGNIGDFEHPYWNPGTGKWHTLTRFGKITPYMWTNREGKTNTLKIRRLAMNDSADFKTWNDKRTLTIQPDRLDPGVTQFYGVGAIEQRGDLFVGFLNVLRDDLSMPGVPAGAVQANAGNVAATGGTTSQTGAGLGYTMLAWSRDGVTWQRDRVQSFTISHFNPAQDPNVFFGPDSTVGAWDHAHAWINGVVDVVDETYLYYGGYKNGHKYNAATERQIGVVKMGRNRYVARRAGAGGGTLRTRAMRLDDTLLRLNAKATTGTIHVRILDADGRVIPGYDYGDGQGFSGDEIDGIYNWNNPVASLAGRDIMLEFSLPASAALYGFQFGATANYDDWAAEIPWPTPENGFTDVTAGNSVANGAYYAMGLDPTDPASASRFPSLDVTPTGAERLASLRVRERIDDPTLSLVIETTSELGVPWSAWEPDGVSVFREVIDADVDGDGSTALVLYRMTTSASRLFFRVRVTGP